MPTSQQPQRLAALLCFALFFSRAICSTDNLSCYSSSCTQSVDFYASGIDSKTININVPALSQATINVYVSDNEQAIDLALSSTSGPITSTVSVNTKVLLQPGNAYSWSGYINLPSTSTVSRRIVYKLTNYNYLSVNVQINMDITRFGSYSGTASSINLIAVIVPVIIGLFSLAGCGICHIRRRRRHKIRQQRPTVHARTLDPIATSRQPMQDQQQISYGFPQSPQNMADMQNTQYYPNQYQQYPQGQYMQDYFQGYNQDQAAYYPSQNQVPTYVMQA